MLQLKFKHINELLESYDLLLFDLWGVIIEGEETYQGVVESINSIIEKKKVVFLTNAPRPNFVVARNMQNWGIKNVTPEMVTTSGDMARDKILKHQHFTKGLRPKIFHLGADRNNDILLQIECQQVDDINQADILLISLYRDEHEDINEFDDLLQQAAKLPNLISMCCNPDIMIPKRGITRYCAGYFASIVEKWGGNVVYTGKPYTTIYERVFAQHKEINKNRILMVGDTFETDILGAYNTGIDSALVLTGNSLAFHKHHFEIGNKLESLTTHAQNIGIRPTFVTQLADSF